MSHSLHTASPPGSYDNPYHISLSTANNFHEINLSCAIQPGALEDSYSIVWQKISANSTTELASNSYVITVTVNVSVELPHYRCVVNVQHRSDLATTAFYYGPEIIIIWESSMNK